MKIHKLGNYFSATVALLASLRNPSSFFLTILGFKPQLHFKNGIKLKVRNSLDLLFAKENILDDIYRLSAVKTANLIVDGGASIGDFTLFARQKFPDAHIVCFEPDKKCFEVLQENLQANAARNITAYNFALGKGSSARSLGEFIDAPIDFLKIDCEGEEVEILKSIEAAHLQKVKFIALEYHNQLLPEADQQLITLLSASGFTCSRVPDPYNNWMGYVFAYNQKLASGAMHPVASSASVASNA